MTDPTTTRKITFEELQSILQVGDSVGLTSGVLYLQAFVGELTKTDIRFRDGVGNRVHTLEKMHIGRIDYTDGPYTKPFVILQIANKIVVGDLKISTRNYYCKKLPPIKEK